jgi:hypothetical protein
MISGSEKSRHLTPKETEVFKVSPLSLNFRDKAIVDGIYESCHGTNSPNGPHAASIEAHTHHKKETAGNECISCHMPKIEQEIADVNVRSHTFLFIPPSQTASLKVPNACNGCHADKSPQWASEALRTWSNVSPWRVAN